MHPQSTKAVLDRNGYKIKRIGYNEFQVIGIKSALIRYTGNTEGVREFARSLK